MDGVDTRIDSVILLPDAEEHEIKVFFYNKITTAFQLFFDCYNIISLDISNLDTSSVTDMGGMFSRCLDLTSLNIDNIDTSRVTDMNSLVSGCKFTQFVFPPIDTSNVTNMQAMFFQCPILTSVDLSNFDISNVTNMVGLFDYCRSLEYIKMMGDPSNLNTYRDIFGYIPENGKFVYDRRYDYSKIIAELPSTWTAVPA